MALDPRLIIQMLAVSENGSISRAAEALGISQPALSNSIAALEHQLGVRLLDRTRQGSKLTECGVSVSRCASALNSIMSNMAEEVKAKAAGTTGPLSIGVTPIAAATLVPEVIAKLIGSMPDLTLSVIEGSDDHLLDLLVKGNIELSVGPIGVDPVPSSIVEEGLLEDPFALIVRPAHALARVRSLKLGDIVGEQWILPDHGSAYRRHVEAIFLTAGIPLPQSSVNTNSRAMIEELLLRTNRVAIMSQKLMSRRNCAPFVCIKLSDAGVPRKLGIKRLRQVQLSLPASTLMALLREPVSAMRQKPRDLTKPARARCHNPSQ